MRPLRLDVEGFTCYRERQPPLDFSSLSLFAIAGPTGAGKSSILDTMLYALYGKVPRMGKQDVGEFISHGRDVMSVCLDFRVQGRDYRVTRLSKRSRARAIKTDATLAELTGGLEKSLADQVRPVNDAIVTLLGLGYDEFIQTVVLPQGDFAKFLKAKPTEQRAILQHLLRHDVFTRMRDQAEERRRALSARVDVIDGKLTIHAEATPEALAVREAALVEARARVEAAAASRDAADAALKEAQHLHGLSQEVTRLREQRQALDQQAPAVERARAEMDQARRAAPVVPHIDAVGKATTREAEARLASGEAAKAAVLAANTRTSAATQREAASAAAAGCAALALRVQALDEIAGDIAQRVTLTTALDALPVLVAAAGKEATATRKAETAARKKVEAAQSTLGAFTAAHDAVAFDEPLYAQVESAYARVGEARALDSEVTTLVSESQAATAGHATAQRGEEDARAAHQAARQQSASAARDADTARAKLDEARVRHAAADIRAHLHEGDHCPVCLQTVNELPTTEAGPELAALELAARLAAEREKKAEGVREGASNALATATARLAAAVTAADAAAARLESRQSAFSSLLMKVAASVPAAPAESVGGIAAREGATRGGAAVAVPSLSPALFDWIERRHGELRAAKDERHRHAQAQHRAAAELSDAKLALARAENEAQAAQTRHEQLAAEQARLQADLAVVVARIHAVTTSDDPRAERQVLAGRIAQLHEAERAAVEALTRADLAVTTTAERARAADAALGQADADLAASRAGLATALAEAGFTAAEEATAAMRSQPRQAALGAQVTQFDQLSASIVHRLAELGPLVAGREVSAQALADAERRCHIAMDTWQTASQQVNTLASEVAHLQKNLKARAAFAAEREALQATLAVTTEMAADLRGDRFQEYLLEEAFRGLVSGASVRMRNISNRYTLEWADSEFHVVDHDNAGERRRADTLSGGETFMASLCLALQLSETVLQASGALQMDSLFIDEGFGTLDTDALSEVTDAIEALGQDGGRLIGVISHRAELTDRLPGLIRIDKGAGESRWAMERIG